MSQVFDTSGRRRVMPPTETHQDSTAAPMEVWLYPWERVEWIYSYGADGKRYVIGYITMPADNDPSSTNGRQTWRG